MSPIELSDSTIARFKVDGAVAPRGLLDQSWIDALRAAVPELLEGAYDPVARMRRDAPYSPAAVRQSSGTWNESATTPR